METGRVWGAVLVLALIVGCGGVEVRRWGAEGYRVGTIAAARKGRLYVHGEALVALRDHLAERGSIDDEVPSIGAGGFRCTDPTLGAGTVVRTGIHVAGIHGDLPVEARERVLSELVATIP